MREFIYFSSKARTSGNFDSGRLMEAGRMDIACHVLINAFFISHKIREDAKLHMIFYGAPDPPKHLEFQPSKQIEGVQNQIDISKKDVAGLIKRLLYKYKAGIKNEIAPGYWIEKKNLFAVLDELRAEGKEIYVLDPKGEDIRDIKISENPVFLLGDHDGLPAKELKRLKKMCVPVSIGDKTYFASQVVTIVSNELDRRGL